MRIRTMRVNHLKTPLGFACSYPVFSWITEECRGKRQTQARMRIALDQKMEKVVYDSEWQQEIKSTAFCPNVQLSPRTRYYWQVQIRTEKGEQGSSPITWFETGKMEELWQGHWIKAVFSDENSNGCPLFQKTFQVPEDLASARVYLTGMGMLEVVVNGQRVSEEYLAPYDTKSGHWIQYVTYDLTELLKKGKENVLGVSMGNGWDTAGIGFKAESKEQPVHELKLLAEIRMETNLGKELVVSTDDSWECAPSPVLESRMYETEVYDARRSRADFAVPGSALPAQAVYAEKPDIEVRDRLSPPVINAGKIRPVKRNVMPSGELLLDFGRVFTGWVEFECREPRDREICLEYKETLEEKEEKAQMKYISDGTPRHVRPHFTVFTFRYVKVRGIKEVKPGDFTGVVVHPGIRRTGEIRTSDSRWNRLFQDSLWNQRRNWNPGTACSASCFHMYTPGLYRNYFWELKTAVNPDESRILQKKAAQLPWMLYLFYGDEILLAEQYPVMQTCMDKEAVFSYEDAMLTAKAAKVLGLVQDAKFYRTLADKMHFAKTDKNKMESETQTAEWMYRHLCGLNPTVSGSGFKRAIIAPKPDREMEYAECTYDSASGRYASGWEWTAQGICFRVTVPFDAKARFELPFAGKQVRVNRKPCRKLEKTGKLVLNAGTYEITVRL